MKTGRPEYLTPSTPSKGGARPGLTHFCWPLALALRVGPIFAGPGPGPVGPGQGRVRVDPDPSNVFKIKYINIIKLYNYLYTKRYTYKVYTDVEKIGQWVQKCMMVVRKCDVVLKNGWWVQKSMMDQ